MIPFCSVMLLELPIRLALSCFQAFTSLKVNVGKSEIVHVGKVGNVGARWVVCL